MEYTKEQIERIEVLIKNTFYYVEYSVPVQEYCWKDREGKLTSMEDMSLDHLKASAKIIERDVQNFETSVIKKDQNCPIYEKEILIPAKKKRRELEEVLREKASS